jgi:hypothetical protein
MSRVRPYAVKPACSARRACSSSAPGCPCFDHARRVADRRRTGGHRLDHHRAGTDLGPITDLETAQHLRTGADHHATTQRRMPLGAAVKRGAAQRHALIDRAVIADHRRFADHHAHAVIDEHAPPHRGARVDFDAGEHAPDVRNEASEPGETAAPAEIRRAMQHQRVDARIAGEHFEGRACGRIACKHAGDIFAQVSKHLSSYLLAEETPTALPDA